MTLTKPDFALGVPNPNRILITDAEWWLWLRLHELEPKSELGGIYAPKKGFHNLGAANHDEGQGQRGTDYSIRDAINRHGAGMTHASALDWTFPDAQRGDYRTIDRYSGRLIRSALDQHDPRLDMVLFEFYGQTDTDPYVEGYNEYSEEPVTSDSSHLWHLHMSFLRSACDDYWGMWALLTVLMGWTVAEWRASLPTPPTPPPKPKPPVPTGLPVHALGSRVIKLGMTGTDVRTYQTFLGKVPPTGKFGPDTEARTRWYQRMRGYRVDGIAGPQTLGPIVKALG